MRKTKLLSVIIVLAVLLLLVSCSPYGRFKESEIIGKTSLEIERTYGAFDAAGSVPSDTGLFVSTSCSYVIKEGYQGTHSYVPTKLLTITFDENGVATAIEVREAG